MGEIKMEKKFIISETTLNKIAHYLHSRPMGEVRALMEEVEQSVELVKAEEQDDKNVSD